MSRTDKTKPFWVKLLHGDLASEEYHDHRDGVCDMPPLERAVQWKPGRKCHREFVYTGTHTCCCSLCHSADEYMTRPQKLRREQGKKACRNWQRDY